MARHRFIIGLAAPTLCFTAVACQNCLAAGVVYIAKSPGQSYARQQIETVAKFYGLEFHAALLITNEDRSAALQMIRNAETQAVVVNADALPELNQKQVLAALLKHSHTVSLLIAGISEQTDPALLRSWSAGTITSGKISPIGRGRGSYEFARASSITGPLGGARLPFDQEHGYYFTIDSGQGQRWLMAVAADDLRLPVFANALLDGQEVFFAAAFEVPKTPVISDPFCEQAVFANLAPQIMFLRHAAGERGWHSPGFYANLTIDDLWLREPYGYVSYEGLLAEMNRHNFHSTLAFIPWNFDRNQARMVSLLRANPERFSVAVHGNNHNHQEFGPYETHAFEGQVANIKQGIARMERFSQLTHIPYDPVMVFPHSIAPERTLAALKAYNFLATANSLNVPSDVAAPANPEFALRAATTAFADFPSLRRYSAEVPIPQAQLAVDAYLENPFLFYVHHAFFASGSNAFNMVADRANKLQPDTQWRSLGYIAQHLYLEKLRDDGNYDIRTYAGTIQLTNGHKRDVSYFIEKDENFALPIAVLVDGHPYKYQKSASGLRLELPIRLGMSREVVIKYKNDLILSEIDTSKSSFRINAIRYLSDFRDNDVSKTALGRRFVRSLSESGSIWTGGITSLTGLLVTIAGWFALKGKLTSYGRAATDRRN